MNALTYFYNNIDVFLLVLSRIIAIIMVIPIFSDKSVPEIAKAGLAVLISIIIIYINPSMEVVYDNSIFGYGVIVIREVIVGLAIGFIIYILFQVFLFIGQLISMASGLSMSNMYDPTMAQQVPVLGQLYNYTAITLFLITNGHHRILSGIIYSYNAIPIGTGTLNNSMIELIINILTNYFIISIKIASPIVVTMFILDFALGILARTAPQMNMFVIGFPVKIMISLIMISISTVLISTTYQYVFDQININMINAIQGLSP